MNEIQSVKVVRSEDVMAALGRVFDSLKGQRLPINQVAPDRGLWPVPEFHVAAHALTEPARDAGTMAVPGSLVPETKPD